MRIGRAQQRRSSSGSVRPLPGKAAAALAAPAVPHTFSSMTCFSVDSASTSASCSVMSLLRQRGRGAAQALLSAHPASSSSSQVRHHRRSRGAAAQPARGAAPVRLLQRRLRALGAAANGLCLVAHVGARGVRVEAVAGRKGRGQEARGRSRRRRRVSSAAQRCGNWRNSRRQHVRDALPPLPFGSAPLPRPHSQHGAALVVPARHQQRHAKGSAHAAALLAKPQRQVAQALPAGHGEATASGQVGARSLEAAAGRSTQPPPRPCSSAAPGALSFPAAPPRATPRACVRLSSGMGSL